MNDTVLYREILPKYVFNGDRPTRNGIKALQWAFRAGAIGIFLGSIFQIITPMSEHDAPIIWFTIPLIWTACGLLLSISDRRQQGQLDGNIPTIIFEDRITIPPRRYRKLTGQKDFVHKEQINRIEVRRGDCVQSITKKDFIIWYDSPIGLKIVTKSGKKFNLGSKPPKTVREITELLATRWEIPIKDSSSGMGKGVKYVNNKIIGEFSYDEIMKMNILQ